jgi:acyl-CoA-binding protein
MQRLRCIPPYINVRKTEAEMSDLKTRFEQAAQDVQKLPRRPDNETLLKLYAFYKQSMQGNVSGKRPGMLDIAGQAKYDAWSKVKGLTPEAAMQSYIDLAERLKQ